MNKPIINPPVPYIGEISDFHPGHLLRIQGYLPPTAQRFNINLQTGPNVSPRDDVSLHISVRLAEGYIARNSLIAGNWGDEQGHGNLSIAAGQRFEIIVLCDSNQYKIAVNGQHFCEFPQRIPYSKVSHLAISGDVNVGLIVVEGGAPIADGVPPAAPPQTPAYADLPAGFEPDTQPPQGFQQGGYGPPQGQGGYGNYGPPQGQYMNAGYPTPPPPGYQAQTKQESGLENFLETASTALMGAIGSGAADKLISAISGGGSAGQNQQQPPQQYPPYQQQQQQQQPAFHPSQVGGQGSVGGLGSVGSLLSSFAGDLLSGRKDGKH